MCTGCSACSEGCPQNAITMSQNAEGFLYPTINESKCVDCGLCHSICEKYDRVECTIPMLSYSAYAKSPSQRAGGSSGGIFGVIAEQVLKEGGTVFGAVFDAATQKVMHTSSVTTSLSQMKRSKYVQSDTKNTFSETKRLLKAGKKVFYVGTPCEIEGLLSFLGAEHENLLTMDFICHGVPSPGFFSDTIAYYETMKRQKVVDFTFREKNLGWRKQSVNIYFENGEKIAKRSTDHYYYYCFLQNYTLRRSCFSCDRYKKHLSDITVADYWTVPKEKDDDKGISLIHVNSEKGKRVLDGLKEELLMERYIEKNIEKLSHKKYDIKKRDRFFAFYISNGGEKTIKKYTKIMKKEKFMRSVKRVVGDIFYLPYYLIKWMRR